jgi:hypothetical protein
LAIIENVTNVPLLFLTIDRLYYLNLENRPAQEKRCWRVRACKNLGPPTTTAAETEKINNNNNNNNRILSANNNNNNYYYHQLLQT